MLDDRKAAILHAVVRDYIETAQPVGSNRISALPEVEVSSATVRSEMAALEEQQYLMQPHTSAGRIPTDKGYRFFVDHVRSHRPELDLADKRQINDFFASGHGELESMLSDTTGLLSSLTDWAGVVVGPRSDTATVRSVQLVDLSSHVVLVVAVLSNGVIEKRTIELDSVHTPEVVADASIRLAREVVGLTLGEIGTRQGEPDRLLDAAVAALREARVAGEMFVGGSSNLAAAFNAGGQLRDVLSLLEQQLVMVTLIRNVLSQGKRVAIGEETGLPPLADCSLVVAPCKVSGEQVGTIGVLGPTRMNYPQAMAAVEEVSERLGEALREN